MRPEQISATLAAQLARHGVRLGGDGQTESVSAVAAWRAFGEFVRTPIEIDHPAAEVAGDVALISANQMPLSTSSDPEEIVLLTFQRRATLFWGEEDAPEPDAVMLCGVQLRFPADERTTGLPSLELSGTVPGGLVEPLDDSADLGYLGDFEALVSAFEAAPQYSLLGVPAQQAVLLRPDFDR